MNVALWILPWNQLIVKHYSDSTTIKIAILLSYIICIYRKPTANLDLYDQLKALNTLCNHKK